MNENYILHVEMVVLYIAVQKGHNLASSLFEIHSMIFGCKT